MEKQLLFSITRKDFQITYFNGTGKGGQNRNKVENCVRMKHVETGIMSTGKDERSREQNMKNAFMRIVNNPKFKSWLKIKTAEALVDKKKEEHEIREKVERMTRDEYLKIEYYNPEEIIDKKAPEGAISGNRRKE
jgi:protein subunit release factor A